MNTEEKFLQAVADSKKLAVKPDNETLLLLYGLYKQATEGDAPDNGEYGMFDFVAKAKYEAWKSHAGVSKKDAQNQYIALVMSLESNN